MPRDPTRLNTANVLSNQDKLDATLILCAKRLDIELRFFSRLADVLSASLESPPDCLVIDLDSISNTADLQLQLTLMDGHSVVIAIASDIDVDMANHLMESGVLNLLKKPLEGSHLENCLREAVKLSEQKRELQAAYANFQMKQTALTARQRDILWSVLDGLPTKAIAAKLDVSNRLVELERARLLKIFESESTTELAFKVGELLMLERTLTHRHQPHLSRLRASAMSNPPWAPDVG